jgi:hypothetical protein
VPIPKATRNPRLARLRRATPGGLSRVVKGWPGVSTAAPSN